MLPADCEYHSLKQVALIQQLCGEPNLKPREALFLATQLVNHGFSQAGAFVDRLMTNLQSSSKSEYLTRLRRRHAAIQSIAGLRDIQADGEAVGQLLATSGYVFRRGSFRSDVAVVIFTTKFNNFGFSNVVADALFGQLGVSRLFLKASPEFVYFRGVEGLANSLGDLPQAVDAVLGSHGIRQVMTTGFSSSGYASFYAAMGGRHAGYVGYSVCTDISVASKVPIPDYYNRIRSEVAPDLYLDLRARMMADQSLKHCKLYFGKRDVVDRPQGLHMVDCPNVDLTCHSDAGHDITVQLIEDRTFLEPFVDIMRSL